VWSVTTGWQGSTSQLPTDFLSHPRSTFNHTQSNKPHNSQYVSRDSTRISLMGLSLSLSLSMCVCVAFYFFGSHSICFSSLPVVFVSLRAHPEFSQHRARGWCDVHVMIKQQCLDLFLLASGCWCAHHGILQLIPNKLIVPYFLIEISHWWKWHENIKTNYTLCKKRTSLYILVVQPCQKATCCKGYYRGSSYNHQYMGISWKTFIWLHSSWLPADFPGKEETKLWCTNLF